MSFAFVYFQKTLFLGRLDKAAFEKNKIEGKIQGRRKNLFKN